MKFQKGFTLIELLVVIAIIGILAAIVLVSLRGAPGKAKDTHIKKSLNEARNQAELIWIDLSTYASLCDASNTLNDTKTELSVLEDDIRTQQGGTLTLSCYANVTTYCVKAQLISDTNKYFCVDNTGRTVEDVAANMKCDSTHIVCK